MSAVDVQSGFGDYNFGFSCDKIKKNKLKYKNKWPLILRIFWYCPRLFVTLQHETIIYLLNLQHYEENFFVAFRSHDADAVELHDSGNGNNVDPYVKF